MGISIPTGAARWKEERKIFHLVSSLEFQKIASLEGRQAGRQATSCKAVSFLLFFSARKRRKTPGSHNNKEKKNEKGGWLRLKVEEAAR